MKTTASFKKLSFTKRCLGWSIHAFTASGACVGLLSLFAIYQQNLLLALWLMGCAIFIDAVDGMFARMIQIKHVIPEINGALLDNIVDFVNYTIVPCFFLLVTNFLPESWRILCVMVITFSSAYQFTQVDAKTTDHFFKGFPSYWNIVVFYLFFWQMNRTTNMAILLFLAVLSFVPIKYVYPSRLDYLTNNKYLRLGMVMLTILWGLATSGLLWLYPKSNHFLVAISVGYLLVYIGISLYRTWAPLTSLPMFAEE
ncbi:MAG TPA: CDP-alcohol phosphatidyltransferase family protein [Gammaproteobacteria bacterium]|nr:CDP-alcohol phosphatidyltransferase family protein [Gammaproteobacteria bacterium]